MLVNILRALDSTDVFACVLNDFFQILPGIPNLLRQIVHDISGYEPVFPSALLKLSFAVFVNKQRGYVPEPSGLYPVSLPYFPASSPNLIPLAHLSPIAA